MIVIDILFRIFGSEKYHLYTRLTPDPIKIDSSQVYYNLDFVDATYLYVGLSLIVISISRVVIFCLCLRWAEITRCVFYLECLSLSIAFLMPHANKLMLLLAANTLLTCVFYHDALPNLICLNLNTLFIMNVLFSLVYREPDTTCMNQIMILTCTNLVFICFTTALTFTIQVLTQADDEVKRYQ